MNKMRIYRLKLFVVAHIFHIRKGAMLIGSF